MATFLKSFVITLLLLTLTFAVGTTVLLYGVTGVIEQGTEQIVKDRKAKNEAWMKEQEAILEAHDAFERRWPPLRTEFYEGIERARILGTSKATFSQSWDNYSLGFVRQRWINDFGKEKADLMLVSMRKRVATILSRDYGTWL
jgi:hypothetical protein